MCELILGFYSQSLLREVASLLQSAQHTGNTCFNSSSVCVGMCVPMCRFDALFQISTHLVLFLPGKAFERQTVVSFDITLSEKC